MKEQLIRYVKIDGDRDNCRLTEDRDCVFLQDRVFGEVKCQKMNRPLSDVYNCLKGPVDG